jgi:hypothetical protein
MTNEVTVPLLPCASIDDIVTFYEVLGSEAVKVVETRAG